MPSFIHHFGMLWHLSHRSNSFSWTCVQIYQMPCHLLAYLITSKRQTWYMAFYNIYAHKYHPNSLQSVTPTPTTIPTPYTSIAPSHYLWHNIVIDPGFIHNQDICPGCSLLTISAIAGNATNYLQSFPSMTPTGIISPCMQSCRMQQAFTMGSSPLATNVLLATLQQQCCRHQMIMGIMSPQCHWCHEVGGFINKNNR
jgi:hypothetical protein